jgi:nitrate/nitrite-specific signal transduction histidine kinase
MEERASLLGGQFSIHSRQGEGTTVEVSIPNIPEEKEAKHDDNPPVARG